MIIAKDDIICELLFLLSVFVLQGVEIVKLLIKEDIINLVIDLLSHNYIQVLSSIIII